jgi:hypothetical protein
MFFDAWKEDAKPTWREHVMPYIYRHPEIFNVPGCSQRHRSLNDADTFEDLASSEKSMIISATALFLD